MIKNTLFLIALLITAAITKSPAQCLDKDPLFNNGEYIKYEVAYNWGMLWVNAGEVYFKTDTLIKENQKYYQYQSEGKTYPFYDWFFKVRNRYESTVKAEQFCPEYFHRSTFEGKYQVINEYNYSSDEQKIFLSLFNNKEQLRRDTLPFNDCTLDVLSAIYYTRSLDFSTFEMDSTYPINFIIDGEPHKIIIRPHGREIIKTRNNKSYQCIRFTTQLVAGTIFKEGEELTVWVSDDENKLPILIEARVLVGSIKAYLQEYKNLKVPLVSVCP